MPPKRASASKKSPQPSKKHRSTSDISDADGKAVAQKLLSSRTSYCDELGIDLAGGGSSAVFQWLCCSIIFGNRLSEKTTIRAAKGLLKSGLTDPKSLNETDLQQKIEALNSEGNVQRGPSMSSRLEATAAAVIEDYEGDLEKLRDAADKDPVKERELIKKFKGFGDVAVNIFCREAQLAWEELFPFADENTLQMAGNQGLPSGSAKDLAALVDNDKSKFVTLLAAVVKTELRDDKKDEEAKEMVKNDSKEEGKTSAKDGPQGEVPEDENAKEVGAEEENEGPGDEVAQEEAAEEAEKK